MNSLVRLLERLPDPDFRSVIVDKVFAHERVQPLLPDYYPGPEEARAQWDILQNICSVLEAIKMPRSSGMLARKYAILEATVSELDLDITNFHSILGTRKENLLATAERLRSAASTASTPFPLPSRKKRWGGLSEEVKVAVILWWIDQTRVTPRWQDVHRKRLGRNLYDTHAAHLLLETQVHPTLPIFLIVICTACFNSLSMTHECFGPPLLRRRILTS